MTLLEAKLAMQKGEKMTHLFFSPNEYATMIGNIIVFEDGCEVFFDEWVENKDYLEDGWELFT